MRGANLFLAGLAAGAVGCYFLDPRLGRYRRSKARDQAVRLSRKTSHSLDAARRDLSNRFHGVVAETQGLFSGESPSDEVLIERVRSKLGRLTSHPGAVEVTAKDGQVIISGPVLASEIEQVIEGIRGVRGVDKIDNRLQAKESAAGVSALQGGRQRPGEASEFFQENWAPGMRWVAGAAGAVLGFTALARHSLTSFALAPLGFALLSRAVGGNKQCNPTERVTATQPSRVAARAS